LYGALDRFAQFFIAPLFLEETLDRELKAVDSENKKNLQSDMWRLHQLSKSLSNPKHPSCHFSTGNLQTLRDEPLARGVKIRDEFIRFHTEQYSANRMKLVVLGRETLEQMQSWVEELFADVRNKDLPPNRWDGIPPYTDKELLTQVNAKPVMDTRSLDLYFPYQDEEEMYESQPGRYLSHLIGHEGPGSILSYIKAKGWATELSSGSYPLCPGSAFFTVDIKLTPEGLKHYREVIKTVFQYISIVRESGPQEWIFDEVKGMAEVDFKFRQKSPASATTSALSQTMQKPLPREWLLSGQSLLRRFDAKAVHKAISYLNAENFRLTVVSQDPLDGAVQNEKWYGTEYTVEKIPADFLAELREAASGKQRPSDLFLPMKNEFIPLKLDVEKKETKEPATAPKLIRNEDNVRVWFKKDDQFWVPKANVQIILRSPLCNMSPSSAVISQVFVELVQDSLDEYAYNAEIAGLRYDLDSNSVGVHVTVSGYNDKMSVLLDRVLKSMRNLEVKQDRFDIIKERLTRTFQNWDLAPPYHQIGQYTRWLATERLFSIEQYLAELPQITAEDIRAFYPLLLSQLHMEILVHGNLYREDALMLTDLVERILRPRKLLPSQWPIRRSLVIPSGSNFLYVRPLKDPSNVNHCIEYLVSVGDVRHRSNYARLILFAQLTDEPAFNQLRTKEQLGYVVFSGSATHVTTAAYTVLIQSERSPDYLENRIDSFLRNFKQVLADISPEEFEAQKRSVINKRLEKLKNLGSETNRFWNHITSEFYRFDEVDVDVGHLRALTKEDIVDFYERYIDPTSPTRAKMSIHLVAPTPPPVTVADKLSPAEQMQGLLSLMQQYLESQNMKVDAEKLASRFNGVSVPAGNQGGILKALSTYLENDAAIPSQQANAVTEQARALMPSVLQNLGIMATVSEEADDVDKENLPPQAQVVVIEDVHAFKASLPLSTGAMPVVDLSYYEDIEPKL